MTTANFRARLEPELSCADLNDRAQRAYAYTMDAIAAGDWDLFSRAVTRLLDRWDQWESLAPQYPAWMARQRYDQLWAISEATPSPSPTDVPLALWDRMTAAMHGLAARAEA